MRSDSARWAVAFSWVVSQPVRAAAPIAPQSTRTASWRRRTLRVAASSVGQIALLFGLPAPLPRLVRHAPDRSRWNGLAEGTAHVLLRPLLARVAEEGGRAVVLDQVAQVHE